MKISVTKYLALSLICIAVVIGVFYAFQPIRAAFTIGKSQNTLSQGLVGHWSFDEDAGTVVPDHSGQGNTGTATGGPTATDGKLGRALSFDGVNDQMDVPVNLNNHTKVTASMWIYTYDLTSMDGGRYQVISNDNGSFGRVINIYPTYYELFTTTGQGARYTITPTTGRWEHVVGTWSTAGTTLYIDGRVVATGSADGGTYNDGTTVRVGASLGGGNYYDGIVDDVRIYSRVLSADEVKRLYNLRPVAVKPGPPNTGLIGYWPFDKSDVSGDTVTDRSGLGNNGTLTRGPVTTTGKLGQAISFDGSNDSINFSNRISPASTDSHSYAAWIYINAYGGGDTYIIASEGNNGGTANGTALNITSVGKLNFKSKWTAGSTLSNATVGTGAWNHVASSYDSSTGKVTLYINGGTDSTSGALAAWTSGNDPFLIGAFSTGGDYSFNGKIDDVRYYNRTLSAGEITALYNARGRGTVNASPTNRLTSGLVGYWTFDGKDMNWATGAVTDRSGQGNNGKVVAMSTSTTPTIGKFGQGFLFDGVDDYVSAGTGSPVNFDSSNSFTLSAWIKTSDTTTSYPAIITKALGASPYTGYWFRTYSTTGNLSFQLYSSVGGVGLLGQKSVATVNNGVWRHVVATYNGSSLSSGIGLYIDGSVAPSTVDELGSFSGSIQSVASLKIGGDTQASPSYFNGSLDDVRVYNRALSASEVKQLYNAGR